MTAHDEAVAALEEHQHIVRRDRHWDGRGYHLDAETEWCAVKTESLERLGRALDTAAKKS